jgi:hypothetical protein
LSAEEQFFRSHNGYSLDRDFSDLDRKLYLAVHGADLANSQSRNDVTRKNNNSSNISSVILINDVDGNNNSNNNVNNDMNFGNIRRSDNVRDVGNDAFENESIVYDDSEQLRNGLMFPSFDLLDEERESEMSGRKDSYATMRRKVLGAGQRSLGQELAREAVNRELVNATGRSGSSVDKWDPMALLLPNDKRKQLVKEVDSGEDDFIPFPGAMSGPIRSKGAAVYGRDNALCGMMNDMNTVLRGTSQAMSLVLDQRGEEAVKQSAKVLVLSSHVLAKMNAERMRIHYPRAVVNRVLRPMTEDIMRPEYRSRAKLSAQELKDYNAISRSFLSKGGKSGKDQYYQQRRQFRPGKFSFPQNQYQYQHQYNSRPRRSSKHQFQPKQNRQGQNNSSNSNSSKA